MQEFNGYMKAINKVVELETGEEKKESLTGKEGAKMAKMILGKKKK